MASLWYRKMAAVVLLFVNINAAKSHVERSSMSSEMSDEGAITNVGRKVNRRNNVVDYEHEGLPIEMPVRPARRFLPETERPVYTNTMPPTSSIRTTTRFRYESRQFRRVYNPDEIANIEDYPYMAALLVNNELWCGAVIIDSDKMLTAAHCLQLQYNNRFFREYVKMLTLRVGSTNATSGGELLAVSEIFFHPNYKPTTLEFNFAVLRTHKNMTFGRKDTFIQSIPVSRDLVVPADNDVTFLGWGSVLGVNGAGGQVLLQKVNLPVYDAADCQETYGRDLVTRTNFCAGFITIPKNVCNHDAGGPAIMDGQLIGILSFSSKRCDQSDQPAVFSSVGAVADWLDNLGEKKVQLRNTAIKLPAVVPPPE